ncbi:hypothetical protein [Treponema bryantii]|uniref:hypothetical protein n=1 Tax=Treponema bryantii TaxID=163 RepID=UPI0003B35411|nr:hypothetical protein [Treponema bryantii]
MDYILAFLLALLIFLVKAAPLWIVIAIIIYIIKQPSDKKENKPDFTFEMDGKTYDAYEVEDDDTFNNAAIWDD